MDRTAIVFWSMLVLSCYSFPATGQCDLGKNYAVFFGVADYRANNDWASLKYPIDNSESVAQILREYYGFTTKVISNPDRMQIWDELYVLKEKRWGPNDQLLLFFSGHGEKGFFIPKNGRKGREQTTAIHFNKALQDFLNDIPCNHQLVVIDACYSGSFFTGEFRSGGGDDGWKEKFIEDNQDKNLQILCSHQSRKTRLAMTSASSDDPSPDQSKLAKAFKNMLLNWSNRNEILYTGDIYQTLKKESAAPLFDEFHDSNDPASSFVFIPEKIRLEYEQASPCPIDPVDCAFKTDICPECPEDPTQKSYRVEWLNGKLWMMENLDFPNYGNSFCESCEGFGHLYTWDQALSACQALGPGWRLPTIREWEELAVEWGEGYATSGIGLSGRGNAKASYKKLMAEESKWKPTLAGFVDGKLKGQGKEGLYWSSSQANGGFDAYVFSFWEYGVLETSKRKGLALSCRCVKD